MKTMVGKLIISVACLTWTSAMAASIDSAGSGNWTNTATWSGGTVPGLDDQANIKWAHMIDVNSEQTVGNVYMVGNTYLNIGVGADLTVDNSGAQNGQVLLDDKTKAAVIDIFGWGKFNPKAAFKVNAGGAGVTNKVSVSYGGLTMGGWTYWGEDGAGEAMLEIGQNANVKMWGKENRLMSNSIVQFTFNDVGESSTLEVNKEDGFLDIQAGADLVVDMSAMGTEDVGVLGSELVLVEINGASGYVNGTWDNVSFVGDSAVTSCYTLSYNGGTGDDVVLTVTSEPGSSAPEIGDVSLSMTGSDAVISWQGTNGVAYVLQRKLDLASTNAWSSILTNLSASVGTLSATNTADEPAAFYRVIVE